ncbi:histidine phosphatase family protein [Parasphingorhabdus pacifica]
MTRDGLRLTPRPGTRLVLARHGQTPSNLRRALDTLPPGPGLTAEGHEQARGLAERLAADDVVAVHASRAVRAQDTARPLAAKHGLDVDVVDGTHEVYVGELEGSTTAAARKHFEEVYASWHFGKLDAPMPGGETGRQAVTRFLRATQRAVDGIRTGTVVMVSHGAMLRLVAAQLAANVDQEQANAAYLPNAGTIVLDPVPGSETGWHYTTWDGLVPEAGPKSLG